MCWAYQALAGTFHSQPLPPKMLWLVRAVQPRWLGPKALRVAVRQAGAWDRVLCLHGRQIDYGRPAAVLSPETLRETYGAELIVLEGGEQAVGIGHHGHAH